MLADFIAEGHFVPHVRRIRDVYVERCETLLASITHKFDDALLMYDGASGLHLVLDLPTSISDVAVADLALADDVVTHPLS